MADQEDDARPDGALSLEHDEHGVLVLRLGGSGTVIPKSIPVVDGSGKLIAVYAAGPAVVRVAEQDLARMPDPPSAPAPAPPVPDFPAPDPER
ncbi:hypothetical protein BLA24_06925 [Streptomyces cinnamoneus]|uniref:Uncharacterized protein n=1 Tax=Streptomyces cinnamoneus TaxID=53446 RepID=A0A2G1XML7_STRCJ|nr:hypothetical protein [Streptomyces cinnamoneus]PHQ52504.1 hypothetical protein BLA24_06925 [Streptomyces cinnamoneus]PPT16039.1 hypothetical protein CYQ11_27075 [Streptomyces cinnamoneus]